MNSGNEGHFPQKLPTLFHCCDGDSIARFRGTGGGQEKGSWWRGCGRLRSVLTATSEVVVKPVFLDPPFQGGGPSMALPAASFLPNQDPGPWAERGSGIGPAGAEAALGLWSRFSAR